MSSSSLHIKVLECEHQKIMNADPLFFCCHQPFLLNPVEVRYLFRCNNALWRKLPFSLISRITLFDMARAQWYLSSTGKCNEQVPA